VGDVRPRGGRVRAHPVSICEMSARVLTYQHPATPEVANVEIRIHATCAWRRGSARSTHPTPSTSTTR
jgi:hypothetical protein